jgi:hypothetical protein
MLAVFFDGESKSLGLVGKPRIETRAQFPGKRSEWVWNITQTFGNRDPIRGLVALARE